MFDCLFIKTLVWLNVRELIHLKKKKKVKKNSFRNHPSLLNKEAESNRAEKKKAVEGGGNVHREEKKTEVAVLGRARWVVLSVYLVCEGDGNRAATVANSLRAEKNIHVDRQNPGREESQTDLGANRHTNALSAHETHY